MECPYFFAFIGWVWDTMCKVQDIHASNLRLPPRSCRQSTATTRPILTHSNVLGSGTGTLAHSSSEILYSEDVNDWQRLMPNLVNILLREKDPPSLGII